MSDTSQGPGWRHTGNGGGHPTASGDEVPTQRPPGRHWAQPRPPPVQVSPPSRRRRKPGRGCLVWGVGLVALVLIVVIVVLALVGPKSTAKSRSGPPVPLTDRIAGAPSYTGPAADDVAAAKACHIFQLFTTGQATGAQVLDALAGLGGPGAKWSTLSGDIAATSADITNKDPAKIASDGNRVVALCGSIPVPAKQAGGYTR
jgi:hypothetical protein